MNALFQAIKTKFVASVSNSIPIYLDVIPQVSFPYVRVVGPEAELERFFDGQYAEETEIQFSVFDDDLADASALLDSIVAAFDRVSLTLSSGVCNRFIFVRHAVGRDHSDKSDAEIYHARGHFNVKFTPS